MSNRSDFPHLDGSVLRELLDLPSLASAMQSAFAGTEAPPRLHAASTSGTLLIMPAWGVKAYTGSKLVTIQASNRQRGLPLIHGVYVLFAPGSGVPLCTMDGGVLTVLRTAATSAAAAARLAARRSSLLVVGSGRLAPWLARAHHAVSACERVHIWARDHEAAASIAAELRDRDVPAEHAPDLAAAVASADIVSTATTSTNPLLTATMVRDHVHLDLVGAYTAEMAEAAPAWFRGAHVVVDTWAGARSEAGDVLQAVEAGALEWQDVAGTLGDLFAGRADAPSHAPRTIFKSVGASQEDLAAAVLAWERFSA